MIVKASLFSFLPSATQVLYVFALKVRASILRCIVWYCILGRINLGADGAVPQGPAL